MVKTINAYNFASNRLHSKSIPVPCVAAQSCTTPRAKFAPRVSRVIQCVSDIVKRALHRLSLRARLYVRCWAPSPRL